MKLLALVEGDPVEAEGFLCEHDGRMWLVESSSWPAPRTIDGPPVAVLIEGLPSRADGEHLRVYGAWRANRIVVTEALRTAPPPVQMLLLDAGEPSREEREAVYGTWSEANPPPGSDLSAEGVISAIT